MILLCLWADSDIHYVIARRVCHLWYDTQNKLSCNGHLMHTAKIIKFMWKYPEYFLKINSKSSRFNTVVDVAMDTCMQHSLIDVCLQMLRTLGKPETLALPYALKYNRQEFVWMHRKHLQQIPACDLAFVYHYKMTELYEIVNCIPDAANWRWTFPDVNVQQIMPILNARYLFCTRHIVFDVDTPEHATRIRNYLHSEFDDFARPILCQKLLSVLSADAIYRYPHTLRMLFNDCQTIPEVIVPSRSHRKNKKAWKFIRTYPTDVVKTIIVQTPINKESKWWIKKIANL